MTIEQLPDFPALNQLAQSLWGNAKIRGAAVMVGAGFSRNLVRPTPHSPLPPLWHDFSKAMSKQLYPDQEGGGPSDPLRLAQEYKVALGETALDNLLREKIQDEQWLPGPLHTQLLKLPWTEVLTTNWDRLLERAAISCVEREYEAVLTTADIARKRSPRIVKLHGSLPSHTPFIFTEDDYRNYPRTHAPFVNLARQVLFENELCLLGFSGDDPNFLQWSGWVRDELGGGQRRIYLVGALSLSSSNRRLLESRGVIPIDLSPLVAKLDKEIQHQQATELFLTFLSDSRPQPAHAWPPKEAPVLSDDEKHFGIPYARPYPALYDKENQPQQCVVPLRAYIKRWQEERLSYPGWLVLPTSIHHSLRQNTSDVVYGLKDVLPLLKEDERGRTIYEIAWRLEIAFSNFTNEFLHLMEAAIVGDFSPSLNINERLYLACILLRIARERNDEPEFARWRQWIEAAAFQHKEYIDLLAKCQYEVCLSYRDALDFESLADEIRNISGGDPIWAIRRAALYCELCDFNSAEREIIKAFEHLKELSICDRRSLWIISRQAWVNFIAHHISFAVENKLFSLEENWFSQYKDNKCDPWQYLQNFEESAQKEMMKEDDDNAYSDIEPGFDPGSATRKYNLFGIGIGIGIGRAPRIATQKLVRLLNEIGLPSHFRIMNVSGKRFLSVFARQELNSVSDILHVIRRLSKAEKAVRVRKFSRVKMAKIPSEFIAPVVERLNSAIRFGIPRLKSASQEYVNEGLNAYWVEKIAYFIDILSHFVCRLSSEEAQKQFSFAYDLSFDTNLQTHDFFEELGNLLRRSFAAIAPCHQSSFALKLLHFPLPSEIRASGMLHRWPELASPQIQMHIDRPEKDSRWDGRISQLIKTTISDNELYKHHAICRLSFLLGNNILHEDEKLELGENLWKDYQNSGALPILSGFHSDTLLRFPAPPHINITKEFCKKHFELISQQDSIEPTFLISIGNAGSEFINKINSCQPNEDQAIRILLFILEFDSKEKEGIQKFSYDKLNYSIGLALAFSILPPINSLDSVLLERILSWVDQKIFGASIRALPQLMRISPTIAPRVIDLLRKRLYSRLNEDVRESIFAIDDWIRLSKSKTLPSLDGKVVSIITGIIMNRRHPYLHNIIGIAVKLVEDNVLSTADVENLTQGLTDLELETAYETWDERHEQSHYLTLLRMECIHLAHALLKAGYQDQVIHNWISIGKTDPMPEVRYANYGD